MFDQIVSLVLGTIGMVACGAAIFWLVGYAFKEGENND